MERICLVFCSGGVLRTLHELMSLIFSQVDYLPLSLVSIIQSNGTNRLEAEE
ncbi:hypothetical protein SAMN05518847_107264 [Paenibacillus sp. OV219]|nr:hypothetical protein SAMN05518847_107264 [Paenibacillus sp. OV219]